MPTYLPRALTYLLGLQRPTLHRRLFWPTVLSVIVLDAMVLFPFLCNKWDFLPPLYQFRNRTAGIVGLYDGQWLFFSQGAAGWDPLDLVTLNHPWPQWARFELTSSPPGPKYASYFLLMVPWWFPIGLAMILPLRWAWLNRRAYRLRPRRQPPGFEIIPIPQPLNPPLPVEPADRSASFGQPH